MSEALVLTVNTGSSSLKLGLYALGHGTERLLLDGLADGIGKEEGVLTLRDGAGKELRSEKLAHATQESALEHLMVWMRERHCVTPSAVGHRIVHGGPQLLKHQRITPAVLDELQRCVHFAPLHIPGSLELIRATERTFAGVPQFACFDTAFHTTLPETASRLPLPQALADEGIRRYGFHGLSYESIVAELGDALPSRVVVAHLGGGSSLAALKEGHSVDTSMGLTPTGGIPMSTRSGDLDPGVLLYLMRVKEMGADALETMLNHASGMVAVSCGVSDMRELLAASDGGDARSKLAVDMFCMAIAKEVAAYAVVLGGLEMLVFAGGIGEHSAAVRKSVCERLALLGVRMDAEANTAGAAVISAKASTAIVRVVKSEEDLQIARHCCRLMAEPIG
jgi:acetate kinase